MGRIFDLFAHLTFRNEAEVSQNFLLPLLTKLLGYSETEILPEHLLPAFRIPQNRQRSISSNRLPPKAKPDFIVKTDDRKVLVCDSKGPNENLDEHLDQLIAYCIALKTNLLLITNGKVLRIYDANNLVFESKDMEDLDLKFTELEKLLNKSSVTQQTDIERLQKIDISRTLSIDAEQTGIERQRRIAVALSNFTQYLNTIVENGTSRNPPSPILNAFDIGLRRFPAEKLHCFRHYDKGSIGIRERSVSYQEILNEQTLASILLVGESGIGKSSLLQQVLLDRTTMCLERKSDVVPVLIKLGQYTSTRSLTQMIHEVLVSRGAHIDFVEMPSLLREGRFLVLLDAFDEVFETHVHEIEREIQTFVDNYDKSRLIVTTRHFRIPRISFKRYQFQPLSNQKIVLFAQMYLGSDHIDFMKEISNKKLQEISSNTFLLTLLIWLYIIEKSLPNSRRKILEAVVNKVRDWVQQKHERFNFSLSWRVRTELLERLGFILIFDGQDRKSDQETVSEILSNILHDLEEHRQIRPGLTIAQVLKSLSATGFIREVDSSVVFWHRVFLEYFAAGEIARRLESNTDFLKQVVKEPKLQEVLPIAVSKAVNPSELISRMMNYNVFISSRALIECDISEGTVYRSLAEQLVVFVNPKQAHLKVFSPTCAFLRNPRLSSVTISKPYKRLLLTTKALSGTFSIVQLARARR